MKGIDSTCAHFVHVPGWMDRWVSGWVDGWVDWWMGGWIGIKAVLRIAYSNQQHWLIYIYIYIYMKM
jgi:hypothetical protein